MASQVGDLDGDFVGELPLFSSMGVVVVGHRAKLAPTLLDELRFGNLMLERDRRKTAGAARCCLSSFFHAGVVTTTTVGFGGVVDLCMARARCSSNRHAGNSGVELVGVELLFMFFVGERLNRARFNSRFH